MGKKLSSFNSISDLTDAWLVPLFKSNNNNFSILPSDFAKSQSLWKSVGSVSAFAGGGQANATQLNKEYSKITVVATNSDSVKLKSAIKGIRQVVENDDSAQNIFIYPQSGEAISTYGTNGAFALQFKSKAEFVCYVDGTWTVESNEKQNVKWIKGYLSQSGTSAPTFVELDNNTGETIVWGYTSVGGYYGTHSLLLTASGNKIVSPQHYIAYFDAIYGSNVMFTGVMIAANKFQVLTNDLIVGTSINDALTSKYLEIYIYP